LEERAMSTEAYLENIIDAVVNTDKEKLEDLVLKGVEEEGIDPLLIVNEGLTPGLKKVGDLFAAEEIFLPELVLAGEIVTQLMEKMKRKLSGSQVVKNKGVFMIATVKGDVHDIGKNLVALLLSASGYDVVDLGKSISAEVILEKVNELSPQILGLSALLSTTMPAQKEVIQTLEEAGMRKKIKILVGGAPVTRAWAKEIGADGYAEDASSAVMEADRVVKGASL
jgi:corrinoid protein of di/trimethylamine methyltransferase